MEAAPGTVNQATGRRKKHPQTAEPHPAAQDLHRAASTFSSSGRGSLLWTLMSCQPTFASLVLVFVGGGGRRGEGGRRVGVVVVWGGFVGVGWGWLGLVGGGWGQLGAVGGSWGRLGVVGGGGLGTRGECGVF